MPRLFVLPALLVSLAALTACQSPSAVSPAVSPAPGPAADQSSVQQALSQSPIADALYRCITARGWQVTLTEEGGIQASSDTIPKEQYQLYLSDTWACNTQVAKQFPVDDNQRHLLYTAELKERACLQAQGYGVADPPTLQSFLDDYDSTPWSAMASSDLAALSQTMSEAAWLAVNRECPQPVPGALH